MKTDAAARSSGLSLDTTKHAPHFQYRAWAISARRNWDLFHLTVQRALEEAPRHNVTCIEFHDYNGSWIDNACRYRGFPRLAQADRLTYYGVGPRQAAERAAIAAHYKDAAKKCRAAGLEVQAWYHCFRDWPHEATEWYPDLKDPDGPALYEFIAENLRDAFDFFPELSGITVTSLHETPSILHFSGQASADERVHRLYAPLVKVCDASGRRLILRDFAATRADLDHFAAVLDRLPDSVWVMTKDVETDWGAHEKPINPAILRYAATRHPVVVEFELSNNFAGELEMPWCDPEYLWRRIRFLAHQNIVGAVGRLVNSHEVLAGTIFDTPNEVMVWAFSRFLVDPGPLLTGPEEHWTREYDRFDASVWTDWAKLRFGDRAAVEVIEILQQTPRLMNLTDNLCGGYFSWCRYWYGAPPKEVWQRSIAGGYHHLQSAVSAVRRCGPELARAEKAEAVRIVADALARIERLKPVLPPAGYENLRGAFLRSRAIVAIYREIAGALLAALDVDAGRVPRETLLAATAKVRAAADAATAAYSDDLLEGTPNGARFVAEFLEGLPGKVAEYCGRE